MWSMLVWPEALDLGRDGEGEGGMVRPLEVRFVPLSGFAPGGDPPQGPRAKKVSKAAPVFEVPGLWTPDVPLENAYRDCINMTVVYLDLHLPRKMKAKLSLRETFYMIYGGNTIKELAELVCGRLNLEVGHPMKFTIDGTLLPEDCVLSSVYNKYVWDGSILTLGCSVDNVKKIFNVDLSVKVPVIPPVHVIEDEVPLPTLRICSVRDAWRASMMSKVGTYSLKDGAPAVLVHGTYGEGGSLVFY
ncbi:uncharacterized protein LOC125515582 isoform X1 [Triticum urartu]|nr:uncharacterized protein LOC125515582 isoform X1 [Triticum urartu]